LGIVSDEAKAFIGMRSKPKVSPEPIGPDALRRFVQATMETNSVHWDQATGEASRFGSVVAPPLYPIHAFRRPSGSPDPLHQDVPDHDWDGVGKSDDRGLPPPPLGLSRHLNGGSEVEFFALAKIGETVTLTSEYVDIIEKEGRQGPFVVVRQDVDYTNEDGQLLLTVHRSAIHR
jgi:acyl dehydratase